MSAAAERKYVLDTNLFIRAFRDAAANAELQRFHQLFAPFEYLSAVVAHELRAEARTPADRRQLERHVLDVYARRDRVITPSTQTWYDSGDLLATLARGKGSSSLGSPRRSPMTCYWRCLAGSMGSCS